MDDLTRQHLDRMERELASLRAASHRGKRTSWRRSWLLGGLLIAMLALTPLGALAANFVDLNGGSPHNNNINAIADAGISRGCTDAQHYCPNEVVTREQMASFLARTAGIGGNPPVANALTAVSAQSATTATNASQLGGIPAGGYLRPVGILTYEVAPAGLVPSGPNVTIFSDRGVGVVRATALGTRIAVLPLPVPSNVFGTTLRLAEVEVCYSTSNAATFINKSSLHYTRRAAITAGVVDEDNQNSTDPVCYTLTETIPTAIAGNPALELIFQFGDPAHEVRITRITVTLEPGPPTPR